MGGKDKIWKFVSPGSAINISNICNTFRARPRADSKKIVHENSQADKATLYMGGAVYENDTLQFVGQEEGRIRFNKTDSSLQYDYFIKDHLGNVRMVLTEEQKTDQYIPASLETNELASERNYYYGVDSGRVNKSTVSGYPSDEYTDPNDYIQKLNGDGYKIGTNIALKVMAGDKFNIYASSWWHNGNSPGSPADPIDDLLAALMTGIGSAPGSKATEAELQSSGVLGPGITSFLGYQDNNYTSSKPKAFVNWILFDEQFRYVANSSGFEQVGSDNSLTPHALNDLTISKNGFLYIYVSNETPNIDVFFDNLQVTHIRGPLLEETHYYPFGLTMAGISSKALKFGYPENRKKYQQYEFNSEFDINLLESFYRSHDPQLGRFWQIDPKPGFAESPYTAMGNNPLRYSDFMGDTAVDKNGKNVTITRNEDGTLSYEFDPSYSAKQKAKVEKAFMKGAAKVLNSLNNSKAGQKIVDRIATISTKVTIDPVKYNRFNKNLIADANSTVTYGNVTENGLYDKVTIQPYLNLYDSKEGATYDEWLGAVMTVEVGHIEKDQIAEEAKGYSKDPKSQDFQRVYTPLLNAATRFMIQYRDEKGMPLIPYNFVPVESYHLKMDEDNQKRKDEMNQPKSQ